MTTPPVDISFPPTLDAVTEICRRIDAALGRRSGDLGPKQIAWLRENLPHFAAAQDQALASKGEKQS